MTTNNNNTSKASNTIINQGSNIEVTSKVTGIKRPQALFAQAHQRYQDAKAHLESNAAMHMAFKQVNKLYKDYNFKGELLPTNTAGDMLYEFSCKLGLALHEANSTERTANGYNPCLVIAKVSNRKLGDMSATYNPSYTCPDTCPLKESGACYAKNGKTNLIWSRINNPKADDKSVSTSLEQTVTKFTVAALEQAQHKDEGAPIIFRFNTAGDFAKNGTGTLDIQALDNMAWAAYKAHELASVIHKGHDLVSYTYTHCEQTYIADKAIRGYHEKYNCTVNYSANTIKEIESAYRANMPVVYAADNVYKAKVELHRKGIKAVVCPNQTRGLTCAQCKLCAKFDRNAVILFSMHGAKAEIGEQVIAKLNNLAD